LAKRSEDQATTPPPQGERTPETQSSPGSEEPKIVSSPDPSPAPPAGEIVPPPSAKEQPKSAKPVAPTRPAMTAAEMKLVAYHNKTSRTVCRECKHENRRTFDWYMQFDEFPCENCGFQMSTQRFSRKVIEEEHELRHKLRL